MTKNAPTQILDMALHPVRMRILMLLSGSAGLTPQQIAERMSDIPQATLYRHINKLAQSRLLAVVAERPVRGTLEKVYALNQAAEPQPETQEEALAAFNNLSAEEHLRYFTAYTLTLLDDFAHYLNRPGPRDLASDGVGYQKLALFLSDEEFAGFTAALVQALTPYMGLENAPGRKKRIFATVMMPSAEPGGPDAVETNHQSEE